LSSLISSSPPMVKPIRAKAKIEIISSLSTSFKVMRLKPETPRITPMRIYQQPREYG
jgi:hypothetical protein